MIVAGGPEELSLNADQQWTPQHCLQLYRGHRPCAGQAPHQCDLELWRRRYDAPAHAGTWLVPLVKVGTYQVTVTGQCADESSLTEQVAVFVGEQPAANVIYDLLLDEALAWEGPWYDITHDRTGRVIYHHMPNRCTAPNPVIVGVLCG